MVSCEARAFETRAFSFFFTMPSTTEVVPCGPYFGFALQSGTQGGSNLEDELTRYMTARRQSGSRLAGASVNGQSFQYGPRGDWNLDEWQSNLQAAFNYLDPGRFPMQGPTNAAVAAFL